ncbi:hypothetical protein J6590_061882 [Homalodisca vitripennis]|nr:hypothetical protein J6590_061882 [Homalodisca vitripennis]
MARYSLTVIINELIEIPPNSDNWPGNRSASSSQTKGKSSLDRKAVRTEVKNIEISVGAAEATDSPGGGKQGQRCVGAVQGNI